MTLFLAAVGAGRVEAVKRILSGCDINGYMNVIDRGLIHAALDGSWDIVIFLLRIGANVDVRYKLGVTSLMVAARAGHFRCVKALME